MTTNIEVVQALYAAYAGGDPDALRGRLQDDVVWREPDYQGDGGSYRGRDAVVAHLFEGEPLVDDYRLDVVDMLASEQRVAIVATTSGTRNGRPVSNDFVQVIRVDGGKVCEVRNYLWDPQGLRDAMAPATETAGA